MSQRLHWPAGRAADGADPVAITPSSAGWRYTGLRVTRLAPGEVTATRHRDCGRCWCCLCGAGAASRSGGGATRGGPFRRPRRNHGFRVPAGGLPGPDLLEHRRPSWRCRAPRRAAGCRRPTYRHARWESRPAARERHPPDQQLLRGRRAAGASPRGRRGAHAGRQLVLLSAAQARRCHRPRGRRSWRRSITSGSRAANGFGLHRTYTADRAIDETVVVHDGDVFLVPRGYHGPCVAPPDYPMYYLNVLAGPSDARSLGFSDDPAYAWIRESWWAMPRDPRVPAGERPRGRSAMSAARRRPRSVSPWRQALVRFLAAQHVERDGVRAARSSPACSGSSGTATSPAWARRCSSTPTGCATTSRATSRRRSTPPPRTPG